MRNMDSLPVNQQLFRRDPGGTYETRAPRKRTFLKGKLVYGDGDFTTDCAIRDISEGGAKIVLTRHQSLPSEIYLIVAKYAVAYSAKIMWVNFPARGLKFSHAYPFTEALPAELNFLRALWLDISARTGVPPDSAKWTPEE
jgi:hypothetical protein